MEKFEQMRKRRYYLNITMDVMEKTCRMLYLLQESGVSIPQENKKDLLDSMKEAEKLAKEFFGEYMFFMDAARAELE